MPAKKPSSRRVRSAMDSVLIHDVKNVEQRLSLLLQNLDEHYGDPDFKRSVVELLNSTVEKLDAIAGRYAAHQDALLIKVPLDLPALAADVARSARPKGAADRRRAPVRVEVDDALPTVWGDPHYLKDALLSVVQNALEAAGEDGHVTVSVRGERRRGRPQAAIVVEDDGPGMTPEFVADRLFRPLQTTKPDGVGLGLYTARQILGFHGGDIRVDSRPGDGTRVTLTLPGEK
jgi:signal transduction histidine kinase